MNSDVNEELREQLSRIDEDMTVAEGFDDAIVGFVYDTDTSRFRVVYDLALMVQCCGPFQTDEELEQAKEYIEFNVLSAKAAESMPLYMSSLKDDEAWR